MGRSNMGDEHELFGSFRWAGRECGLSMFANHLVSEETSSSQKNSAEFNARQGGVTAQR